MWGFILGLSQCPPAQGFLIHISRQWPKHCTTLWSNTLFRLSCLHNLTCSHKLSSCSYKIASCSINVWCLYKFCGCTSYYLIHTNDILFSPVGFKSFYLVHFNYNSCNILISPIIFTNNVFSTSYLVTIPLFTIDHLADTSFYLAHIG